MKKNLRILTIPILTALLSPQSFGATVIWSGASGVDLNWATPGNWEGGVVPANTDDVKFFDPGSDVTPGNPNNIVNSGFSGAVASLQYGNTNNFHTTSISPGVTLTNLGNLVAGTETDNGGVALVTSNMIKGASLVMSNTAASIIVRQGAGGVTGAGATLDLSELDTFTADVSRVQVGDAGINRSTGVLLLAKTNRITATGGSPSISLGLSGSNNGAGRATVLSLGQTNQIYSGSIAVARQKQTAVSMVFNSAFTEPVAIFRGVNTVDRVSTWTIGDGEANSGTTSCNGTVNFTGGTVDARVDTMTVGRASNNTGGTSGGNSRGTLTLENGIIDVNTLLVGIQTASSAKNGDGTVNVNGGLLTVNNTLQLGVATGGAGVATTIGKLNINAGTVAANAIVTGPTSGGSTITMTGGTLILTNTAGSKAVPLNTVSLSDATLDIAGVGASPALAAVNLSTGGSTNLIRIGSLPSIPSYPAQFELISYQGGIGGAGFDNNLGMAPLPGTSVGFLSNNVANSSVDLVVTSGPVPASVVWNGNVNGDWDTSTPNWKIGVASAIYHEGDAATFNDNAAGTPVVNLTTQLVPGGVVVTNNLLTYTFGGPGGLGGTGSLTKQGSGLLILDNTGANSFSGQLLISGGTLQIGNGDANGSVPGGDIQNEGTLAFNRTDNVTFTNILSGTGSLSQLGSGRLTLSTAQNYSGATTVGNGTLALTGAGSISGLGLTSVRNGTLDISAITAPSLALSSVVLSNGTWTIGAKSATVASLDVTNSTISLAPDVNMGALIVAPTVTSGGATNYFNITGILNIPESPVFPISIPLISYTSQSGVFNFGVANLQNAYISNNVANSSIDLVLTAAPFLATWNGGSATGSFWSDTANWSGTPIQAGDSLVFDGNARLNNTNDTAAFTAYTNITFTSGAGAFTLNGSPINGASITNNSSNPQTVNLGLAFGRSIGLNGGTAGLIIGGGLTNTLGAPGSTTVTLSGTGILTNLLGSTTSPGGTNLLAVNDSAANWTLVDNASSETMTAPWALNVIDGTFNFGTASSAPGLVSTSVNGAPQDNLVGATALSTATLNFSNGTFTTSARLNTGTAGNATGIINVYGGTLTAGNQFQGANGAATSFSTVNLYAGTMNVGTVAAPNSTFFVASRGTGTLNMTGTAMLNCGTLDVSRNAAGNTAGSVGVVNLDGGILAVNSVSTLSANSQPGGTPTATFNFNGGILKARTSSSTFYRAGTATPTTPITSYVKAGGAIIDTTNFNISILEPLQHDPDLGVVLDGGLTKRGNGTLTLSADNTYTGPTSVGEGALAINGSLGTTVVTVSNTATLSGTGTVGGSVTVKPGGTVSPAGPNVTGVLTFSGPVTLQGTTYMELNRGVANDQIAGGTLVFGGTLSLTNIGAPLEVGDAFPLFTGGSYSGSFTISGPPGVVWDSSTLTTDGTLRVSAVVSVNPTPTNIVVSVVGNQLNLSWPADHIGWRLQTQTNALSTGLSGNWVDVAGSTTVSSMSFPINPANGTVFFRMVYP